MILMIDNYDSFVYNLYQLIGSIEPDMKVVRNDKITVKEIKALKPQAIVISPGPGKPKDAGICEQVIAQLKGEIPILGVCLGHQAICETLGATVSYAKKMMHGKTSMITIEPDSTLFFGMDSPLKVARYHSLAVVEETLPKELRVTARSEDQEIMAIEHVREPLYGVQFHPESVMTVEGKAIIRNFLSARMKKN